ncbi:2-phospho-L-lactate transferase CofD family protein, partial [Oceanospirillum sp. HFRX-1_2]
MMVNRNPLAADTPPSDLPVVTLLAGGVGGAKAAEGLQATDYASKAAVIANIGDDETFHGLKVCPDIDTLIYSLSDQIDRNKGWGLKEESYQVLSALKDLGRDTWMTLGDKDFATHIYRSQALSSGLTLTEVTEKLAA